MDNEILWPTVFILAFYHSIILGKLNLNDPTLLEAMFIVLSPPHKRFFPPLRLIITDLRAGMDPAEAA